MSQEFPSPRSVTVSFTSAGVGSLLSVVITPSISGAVPSFFIQACPSNIGYILLGVASTVAQMSAQVGSALVASNCIVSLDSGQSVEIKSSEWKERNYNVVFSDYIIAASATVDQAVITFFV